MSIYLFTEQLLVLPILSLIDIVSVAPSVLNVLEKLDEVQPLPESLQVILIVLFLLVQVVLWPVILPHDGALLSIFIVWSAGQTVLLPALSYTVPGDAVVVLVSLLKVLVTLSVQPLPESLQVPVIVKGPLCQLSEPPLLTQLGAVLSI